MSSQMLLKNKIYNKLDQRVPLQVKTIQTTTSNSTAQVTLTWSHQLPGTLCAEFFIEMKNPLAKILRPSKSVLVIKVAMAGRVQPSKHNRVQKNLEFQAETKLMGKSRRLKIHHFTKAHSLSKKFCAMIPFSKNDS